MSRYQRIVILTGAGLSAESGLATFRDKGGVWARYDYREVATPEGFARNPSLVHEFYNMRRRDLKTVAPNAAHMALARLEQEHRGEVLIVTQNVDNLHEAAGSTSLIHMHGELLKVYCTHCRKGCSWTDDLTTELACPSCGKSGGMRPDIVWFGEMPYHMDVIGEALEQADLFISIGTSGNVYPAAGFVAEARASGAHTVELNLEPSEGRSFFHEAIHGPATRIVPGFVDSLLAG
ncbi:MAG: NAD-dependent deacylase [Hyphomicrobiaceae bacterium]|nr:NAD-dependent deacylase [Hyphomicrobiaceae bacterium]MCC0008127.1 NAD-dependent deacylase [Hyphomicrobiaceae bacterium]